VLPYLSRRLIEALRRLFGEQTSRAAPRPDEKAQQIVAIQAIELRDWERELFPLRPGHEGANRGSEARLDANSITL